MVTRLRPGSPPSRRRDALVGEEPLEIRIEGAPTTVTMRTPGNDYELAAGFLVSEGVISEASGFGGAAYCRGETAEGANQFNVLDLTLGPGAEPASLDRERNFPATSSCGICGKAEIDAVVTRSRFEVADDPTRVGLDDLLEMPGRLRRRQRVFERTGGLHAAGLFDLGTGELLVAREDVGRHNAVDKVIGWAVLEDRLPLAGCLLQVSGRAGFELVQKAKMAGIPIFSAVSAPSSLAVELAAEAGITLAGFVRDDSLVAYSRPDRIDSGESEAGSAGRRAVTGGLAG